MATDVTAQPNALPEGVDFEDQIIATYLAIVPAAFNMVFIAPLLAIEQSTGTWVPVPGETPEVRKKHVAKVIGIYEIPYYEYLVEPGVDERNYIIQIAFPFINIECQIPMLLTAVVGNISMAGKVKLLDMRFPKKFADGFKGPKFGIDGIRELMGVPDRPLVNNMIKPCTGYPADVGAQLFYEAAVGGSDIIKDDELIANMSFNTLKERIKKYMKMADRVYEETGEKKLYTINISDEIPKIFENAKTVIELGANAIMVNYLPVGFPVLRALAEDPEINAPILAHMDMAGAFYMSPYHGISSHIILGKLPRLAGADIVVYPAPYGKATFLQERFIQIARNLSYPLYNLKPTWPMASGGITPRMVPQVMADLGHDCIIGTGGGIHAHPMGPVAGAKAFRQAIDATMQGIPLEEAVKEHEELDVALKAW